MDFDFKKNVLYKNLKMKILSGELPKGYKFLPEKEYARQLGVATITLRSTFALLEADGLIVRLRARGTFVNEFEKDYEKNNQDRVLLVLNMSQDILLPQNYILPNLKIKAKEEKIVLETCFINFFENLNYYEAMNIVKKKKIKAVILFGSSFNGDEHILKILKKLKLPVVIPRAASSDHSITGFATIETDYRKARSMAFRHLFKKGHRRIGCIAYTDSGFRGYSRTELKEYLRTNNCSTAKELYAEAYFEKTDKINEIIDNWLAMTNKPTAIMCASDFYAIKIYKQLQKRGQNIPEDIAVMGFGGVSGSAFLSPSLSTINFMYDNIGIKTIEVIKDAENWFHSEYNSKSPRYFSPFELVEGASTSKIVT